MQPIAKNGYTDPPYAMLLANQKKRSSHKILVATVIMLVMILTVMPAMPIHASTASNTIALITLEEIDAGLSKTDMFSINYSVLRFVKMVSFAVIVYGALCFVISYMLGYRSWMKITLFMTLTGVAIYVVMIILL